jgi:flagellar protein FliS
MTKDSIQTFSYRISQASRAELVVVMFDMAIEYVNDALHAEDADEYHRNVKQAKRVIDELCRGLDMQYEISGQLLRVYVAMMRFLVKAGAGDVEKLDTVLHMLTSLRKSFYEVSKQDTTGPLMKNTQQVFAGLTYSSMGTSTEISSDSGKKRGFTV